MKNQTSPSKEKKLKAGRKAETLKIEGNWEEAVSKALEKKRPKEGWPMEEKNGK